MPPPDWNRKKASVAKMSGEMNVVRMKNSLPSRMRTLNQVTNQIRRRVR